MRLEFCVDCGAALKKVTDTHYVCANGHNYWNNPRASAAVIILNDEGKVLISKRRIEPYKDMYNLPGGFIDFGETAAAAARREVMEETSLKIGNLYAVATYTAEYGKGSNISCTVLAMITDGYQGNPVSGDDSASLEWCKPLRIKDEDFIPRYFGVPEIIEDFIAGKYKNVRPLPEK
jgi:8-oxo-dGTP diphosphatase